MWILIEAATSLSPNPLSPLDWGVTPSTATLHPKRVRPRDLGHDCQSHLEDLCSPPPNSVSTCRLRKVLRIEEFVWETWPKSTREEKVLRYLKLAPPSWAKRRLTAYKWQEHCQIYTLPWFHSILDNPFPEINCPIKMKCCPYRFNKLKMLVWILSNLDGIPSM